MIDLLNANVDDVIDNTIAVQWLNAGQNKMASEARASFTQFTISNLNATPNFPEKYHEIFLNVLTSKYLGKVSFGDNPFSECKPMIRRKWWQFWKPKYIEQ